MATIRRDQQAIRSLLNSPEMQRATRKAADEIAARARAIGDAAEPGYGSQVTVSTQTNGGVKRDRAQSTVTAGHPASAAVEFGNRRTQASRPLRRASGR